MSQYKERPQLESGVISVLGEGLLTQERCKGAHVTLLICVLLLMPLFSLSQLRFLILVLLHWRGPTLRTPIFSIGRSNVLKVVPPCERSENARCSQLFALFKNLNKPKTSQNTIPKQAQYKPTTSPTPLPLVTKVFYCPGEIPPAIISGFFSAAQIQQSNQFDR